MHSIWTIGRQAGLRRDTDFMAGKTAVLARKGPRAGRWHVRSWERRAEGWEPFVLRRAWSRPQQGEGARARKGKKVGGRTHELKGVRASCSNPLRLGASGLRGCCARPFRRVPRKSNLISRHAGGEGWGPAFFRVHAPLTRPMACPLGSTLGERKRRTRHHRVTTVSSTGDIRAPRVSRTPLKRSREVGGLKPAGDEGTLAGCGARAAR